MVLKSPPDLREDRTPTSELANGRYRYFNDHRVLDHCSHAGNNLGSQKEEYVNDDYDYDQDTSGTEREEESPSEDVYQNDVGGATGKMSTTSAMRMLYWRGFLRYLENIAQRILTT